MHIIIVLMSYNFLITHFLQQIFWQIAGTTGRWTSSADSRVEAWNAGGGWDITTTTTTIIIIIFECKHS